MIQYEMVFLVRPDLEPDAVRGVVDRIGQRVTEQGGHVDFVDIWGKRRLAYSMQKYREAVYVLTRFTLDSTRIPELKRLTGIMDEVMRSVIVVAEGPTPAPKAAAERPAEAAVPTPAAVSPPPAEEGPVVPAPSAEGETEPVGEAR